MLPLNQIRRAPRPQRTLDAARVATLVTFGMLATSMAFAAPPAPTIERRVGSPTPAVRAPTAPSLLPSATQAPHLMPTNPIGKDPELTTGLLPVALVIRVAPYGDIFVDGERVATASKSVRVFRHPGQHRIEVRHPLAAPQTRNVTLVDQDAATDVRFRLQPKPFQLVVTADEDFTARVDDTVLRGRKGVATAMFIPMKKWAGFAKAEVVFTSKSGRTLRLPLAISAGAQLSQQVQFATAQPVTRRSAATTSDAAMAW